MVYLVVVKNESVFVKDCLFVLYVISVYLKLKEVNGLMNLDELV